MHFLPKPEESENSASYLIILQVKAYVLMIFLDATSSVLLANPFQCGQMTNFVSGDTFLEDLVVELNSQEFCPKSNDLYKFEQVRFKILSVTFSNWLLLRLTVLLIISSLNC